MTSKMKVVAAVLVVSVLCGVRDATAQGKGHLGIGFIAGVPIGFSAKYYATDKVASAIAFGVDDGDLDGHIDLLVHLDNLVPQPKRGALPVFLGFGLKVRDQKNTLYGFRFVGGAAYHFENHPLEIFAEIAPVLRIEPDSGADVDGGVGLRYYFSLGKSPPKKVRRRRPTKTRKTRKKSKTRSRRRKGRPQ